MTKGYELFLNNQRIVPKYLVMSRIFRTFVSVPESTINPIYSPSKTHRSYEQNMENDSSSDQLRHHPPAGRRGWERHDVKVKKEKSKKVKKVKDE